MTANDCVIRINEGQQPYNCQMTLPVEGLQKLMPLLQQEILKGLVSSDQHHRVVLQLFLNKDKIKAVERMMQEWKKAA